MQTRGALTRPRSPRESEFVKKKNLHSRPIPGTLILICSRHTDRLNGPTRIYLPSPPLGGQSNHVRLLHVPPGLAGLCLAFVISSPTRAAVPTDAAKRRRASRQARITARPARNRHTHRAGAGSQQVVVTGKYADGSVRDLTAVCDFALRGRPGHDRGRRLPSWRRRTARRAWVIKAGTQTVKVPLTVKDVAGSRSRSASGMI